MALEPFSILALLGITIILGYVGQIIFEKTKIPDIIWLMVFGITINSIAPGAIATPINTKLLNDPVKLKAKMQSPDNTRIAIRTAINFDFLGQEDS